MCRLPKSGRIIAGLLAIILVAYIAAILIVPPIVDKDYNPTTLLPPYQVSEKAANIYNELPFVADLHCDALLWKRDLLKRHDYGHIDIPRMTEANMALQAFTIVSKTPKNMNYDNNSSDTDNITSLYMAQGRPLRSWFSLSERALVQCEQLFKFADKSDGNFRVITSATELKQFIDDRSKNKSLTAGYLGIEGMQILENDIQNIDEMYDAGIRMMAPTHFFDNEMGGSAHGVSKEGLTDFGKQAIKHMEEKSMIVDIAHASPKMIDNILAVATKPLIVSHTGVKGTCNNVRNLSDYHIKAIASNGGLIGIGLFEAASCGTDAASTAKAIRYTVDLVGIDHVGLGSDFDGAVKAHFDVTGFPLLVDALLDEGFSKEEISKIMGGNIRDFLLNNLPAN